MIDEIALKSVYSMLKAAGYKVDMVEGEPSSSEYLRLDFPGITFYVYINSKIFLASYKHAFHFELSDPDCFDRLLQVLKVTVKGFENVRYPNEW